MRSSLAALSPAELTRRLADVLASERSCVLESLHLFIEMERRETYKQLSHCNSLFAYCVEELHLSEGYTYRRITSARLLARFPAIDDFIRRGLISLSNLCELKDVLTDSNHLDVLNRATHLTKQQTRELVAELQPRPDVAPSLRKLPTPAASTAPRLFSAQAPRVDSAHSPHEAARSSLPSPPLALRPAQSVEPLSPARHLLKATISSETRAKLEKVQAALSHLIPDGNLEDVLDEALSLALQVLAKQHRVAPDAADVKGVTSAAKVEEPEVSDDENSRHIPAALKRYVRLRDEDCCTFVGPNGKRCGSTHQLQFHHRKAFALGGLSTPSNITLHCRAHNVWAAKNDFGPEHMARFTRPPLPDDAPTDLSHARVRRSGG